VGQRGRKTERGCEACAQTGREAKSVKERQRDKERYRERRDRETDR